MQVIILRNSEIPGRQSRQTRLGSGRLIEYCLRGDSTVLIGGEKHDRLPGLENIRVKGYPCEENGQNANLENTQSLEICK